VAPGAAQRPQSPAAERQRWPSWTPAVSRALRMGAGAPRGPLALPAWAADWVAGRLPTSWTLAVRRALRTGAGSPRGPLALPAWTADWVAGRWLPTSRTLAVRRALRTGAGSPRGSLDLPVETADWLAARLPSSTTPAQCCLVWVGLSPLAANRGRRHGSQSTARGPLRFPTARPPGLRRWSTSRSQFVSTFARLQIGAQIYRRLWHLTSLGWSAGPRDAGALQSGNSQALPMGKGAQHIWSAIVATLERPTGSGRLLVI